jgi:hypothetical protein
MLLGVNPAEIIGSRLWVGFIIEDGRVARMCHETGDVPALRQLAGVRGRRVKHNDLAPGRSSLTNVLRIFPISRSGTAMTTASADEIA